LGRLDGKANSGAERTRERGAFRVVQFDGMRIVTASAAQVCGMDPLAFRLQNYPEVEPISGRPFSSKALRECYRQGAARFGWAGRPLAADTRP